MPRASLFCVLFITVLLVRHPLPSPPPSSLSRADPPHALFSCVLVPLLPRLLLLLSVLWAYTAQPSSATRRRPSSPRRQARRTLQAQRRGSTPCTLRLSSSPPRSSWASTRAAFSGQARGATTSGRIPNLSASPHQKLNLKARMRTNIMRRRGRVKTRGRMEIHRRHRL